MSPGGPWTRWLEWLTGLVLAAVVLALGWMLVVAYQPEWLRLASATAEVVGVVVLLGTALLLVSVVALLHTRS
jgi:uncharacterized membrane protein (DUF485 family)